ncbi:uncharacterized protein LOC106054114 isoform X2 [Biomphalaria glabrata]|uniref:Uncharacterized protein LOC106054114 isoform X2 n=1 Tax=Biomphalaria glabrata TaxID=6526 RepID=A0A9W3A3W5_BIOGL|nr:uncharacterized protein LOC106054114 isoform X2 [Biomphalaria glabrata]
MICQAMAKRKTSPAEADASKASHRSTNQVGASGDTEPTSPPSNSQSVSNLKSKSEKSVSEDSSHKFSSLTVYSFLILLLAMVTLYYLPTINIVFNSYLYTEDSLNGGWRPASQEILEKYDTDICNIQRLSVSSLSPANFEKEFRFKKPVLVTFPNGLKDWTDPDLWSRQGLLKAYSNWTLHSGQSLEIVRAGGNAKHRTSFSEFVDSLLAETNKTTNEPLHYGFDRRFYYDTDLPKSLRLPRYFQSNYLEDDSIFFLGSSLTGVVFHKHSDTWNAVAYGKKRWFLYPPSRTPPGGVYHGFTLLDWFHHVYPELTEEEKPIECVQQGGEILYLPEGMYHATLNLGDTIALAIQKKNATTEIEKLSYEATRLNNLMSEISEDDSDKAINMKLREIYERTLELYPDNAEAHHKLGLALFNMGLYRDALPQFMKAIKLDPYFVLAYIHMAKSLAKLRDYVKADVVFQKAIEISPNLWDNYKEYGEFLLQQGRPAHALPIYKKGTELMPELTPFWHYYKHCQQQVGDIEGAKQSEQIIVKLQKQEETQDS